MHRVWVSVRAGVCVDVSITRFGDTSQMSELHLIGMAVDCVAFSIEKAWEYNSEYCIKQCFLYTPYRS